MVKAGIFGALEVEADGEWEIVEMENWESMICEPCELEDNEVIGRPMKLPRDFRLSLIHISEPTRPERIGYGGLWV